MSKFKGRARIMAFAVGTAMLLMRLVYGMHAHAGRAYRPGRRVGGHARLQRRHLHAPHRLCRQRGRLRRRTRRPRDVRLLHLQRLEHAGGRQAARPSPSRTRLPQTSPSTRSGIPANTPSPLTPARASSPTAARPCRSRRRMPAPSPQTQLPENPVPRRRRPRHGRGDLHLPRVARRRRQRGRLHHLDGPGGGYHLHRGVPLHLFAHRHPRFADGATATRRYSSSNRRATTSVTETS